MLAGKIVLQNEMTIQILKEVFSDFHKQKTQPITHVVIGAQKQLSLTDTGACFVVTKCLVISMSEVTLKLASLNVLQKSPNKSVMGLRSIQISLIYRCQFRDASYKPTDTSLN